MVGLILLATEACMVRFNGVYAMGERILSPFRYICELLSFALVEGNYVLYIYNLVGLNHVTLHRYIVSVIVTNLIL